MKQLFQIGAGNIGRGFIARLFFNNGYTVKFADVNERMITMLNSQKEYTVHVVDIHRKSEIISNISAINSKNEVLFNQSFIESDIITLSVGASILQYVAKNIATAVKEKISRNSYKRQTIIACENYVGATSYLKTLIESELNESELQFLNETIDFPDCAVDCIVPPSESSGADVSVEEFYELVLDETKISDADLLACSDITFTDKIFAYIERKLFTLNAAHALISYVGYPCGYKTVYDAIQDERIEQLTVSFMRRNGEVLCLKHRFDENEHEAYIQKILKRFKNPYLEDDLKRVGRSLIRKINNKERLVAPIKIASVLGIDVTLHLKVLALALCYSNQEDVDVKVISLLFQEKSEKDALAFLTELDPKNIDELMSYTEKIRKEGVEWIFHS